MLWYRLVLCKCFHFDPWHVEERKTYAEWMIKKINSMNVKGEIVEIGCGLGDISAGIHNRCKIGYDIDKRVIRAAKFVHPLLKTRVGTFQDIKGQKISLLIAVNFLHNLDEDTFCRYFEHIIARNEIERIVVDEVPCPPYRYAHNYEDYFINKGYKLEYRSKGFRALSGMRHLLFFQNNLLL